MKILIIVLAYIWPMIYILQLVNLNSVERGTYFTLWLIFWSMLFILLDN